MTSDEKVTAKTYIPRYQKEEWAAHAEELEMSQSEFLRTMVQAGRTDFEVPTMSLGEESTDTSDSFESRILDALKQEDTLDWDDLVSILVGDIEEDLDEALQRLQDENKIQYRGRDGGYVVVDHE